MISLSNNFDPCWLFKLLGLNLVKYLVIVFKRSYYDNSVNQNIHKSITKIKPIHCKLNFKFIKHYRNTGGILYINN